MKRYSTTDLNDGRNSLGIFETLSFIQEGASRHDIPTLGERTDRQYWGLRGLCEAAAGHAADVLTLVNGLRLELLTKAAVYDESKARSPAHGLCPRSQEPTLTIRQFEEVPQSQPRILGTLKADRKAGSPCGPRTWFRRRPPGRQGGDDRGQELVSRRRARLSVSRPLGYVIPSAHADVVENLLRLESPSASSTGTASGRRGLYGRGDLSVQYDYLAPKSSMFPRPRSGWPPAGRFLRLLRPAGGESRALPARAAVRVRSDPLLAYKPFPPRGTSGPFIADESPGSAASSLQGWSN